MPYAIFHYPPEDEFELRHQLYLLRTRLEQAGKRVTTVSLAECMMKALENQSVLPRLIEAERKLGPDSVVETVHEVLSRRQPLPELVASSIPRRADPTRDIVFIVRAGALFPFYRTSSLLEQLKGHVSVPSVLFYPGALDGAAGLRFMGILEAEHNYRPKIF